MGTIGPEPMSMMNTGATTKSHNKSPQVSDSLGSRDRMPRKRQQSGHLNRQINMEDLPMHHISSLGAKGGTHSERETTVAPFQDLLAIQAFLQSAQPTAHPLVWEILITSGIKGRMGSNRTHI